MHLNDCRLVHKSNSFLHICARQGVMLNIFMYYWMNSGNIYVLYWTLGSIHVVLHKYSWTTSVGGSIGPATEVIQLDLNYSNTASPWGKPEEIGHNMHAE